MKYGGMLVVGVLGVMVLSSCAPKSKEAAAIQIAKQPFGKTQAGDQVDLYTLTNSKGMEGNMAVSLGDVSGKGMPAALLMANVQATIRAYSILNQASKDCVSQSNDVLFKSTATDKFVTLFYGILDVRKNTFTYTNAGHENPFFLRKGKATSSLKTGGIPLGVVDHFPYDEEKIEFRKGDVLVVFSDGIQDAVDSAGERFGAEKIEQIVRKHMDSSAAEIAVEILEEVKRHVSDTPQFDDMTLLVMKRSG